MNNNDSTLVTDIQHITLEKIQGNSLIVDVGGGSEGLVSRIEGDRVCAVDIKLAKIEEARIHDPASHWFTCDARQLCFQDETFSIATFWFTLGYMSDWETKRSALHEAYRVLRTNGKLSILGSVIDCAEKRFHFQVLLTLPDSTTSKMGYRVNGGQNQTLKTITELCVETGFRIVETESHQHWFKILASIV
ncbi:MAG: class I SAM-dependent methyltransferase [Candidatus Thorarchaeota archaeon]